MASSMTYRVKVSAAHSRAWSISCRVPLGLLSSLVYIVRTDTGTTFIQRVNTTGGKAPSTDGAFVGQVARVPYTADYFFYRPSTN